MASSVKVLRISRREMLWLLTAFLCFTSVRCSEEVGPGLSPNEVQSADSWHDEPEEPSDAGYADFESEAGEAVAYNSRHEDDLEHRLQEDRHHEDTTTTRTTTTEKLTPPPKRVPAKLAPATAVTAAITIRPSSTIARFSPKKHEHVTKSKAESHRHGAPGTRLKATVTASLVGNPGTSTSSSSTTTVFGFLDFTTTIDRTIVVFKPSTAVGISPTVASEFVHSRRTAIPSFAAEPSSINFKPKKSISMESEIPSAWHRADIDIEPSTSILENIADYPTGLVTVLGSTDINSGVTTVRETKVIGTYVSGTYAQVLQSTSKVFVGPSKHYVPDEEEVLQSSSIVPTRASDVLPVSSSTATAQQKVFIKHGHRVQQGRTIRPSVSQTVAEDLAPSRVRFSRELPQIRPSPTMDAPSSSATLSTATPSSRKGSGSSGSLAEQRGRIRALIRRRLGPNMSGGGISTIDFDTIASGSNSHPVKDTSGFRSRSDDQVTAESSDVVPSKVRHFFDLNNLSTFYGAGRNDSSNEFTTPRTNIFNRERTRLVIRKRLQRLPPADSSNAIAKPPIRGRLAPRLASLRRLKLRSQLATETPEIKLPATLSEEKNKIEGRANEVHTKRPPPSTGESIIVDTPTERIKSMDQYSQNNIPRVAEYLPLEGETNVVAPTSSSDDRTEPYQISGLKDESELFKAREHQDLGLTAPTPPELKGSYSDLSLGFSSEATPAKERTEPLPDTLHTKSPKKGHDIHRSGPIAATIPASDHGLTVPLQLSIVTSTFSVTETLLRTSLLPVYDGSSTTFYTLTQSVLVTKTITSFQTVPPDEFLPFLIPGNNTVTSNEVGLDGDSDPHPEGSDHLEQRTPADDRKDGAHSSNALVDKPDSLSIGGGDHKGALNSDNPNSLQASATNVSLANQLQPQNPLLGNLPFLNPAFLNPALGLNPYLAAAYGLGIPRMITTTRPVISTEVIMTTKLLPVIDGLTTSYHTVQTPASTVTHTNYETYTTQVAGGASPLGANPLAAAVANNQFSTMVQPHTYTTTETITSTQVFKLMYDGYKTSYRTVIGTTSTVRIVTTTTTNTVASLPTMLPFFG